MSPTFTVSPVPTTRSLTSSLVGAGVAGTTITGLDLSCGDAVINGAPLADVVVEPADASTESPLSLLPLVRKVSSTTTNSAAPATSAMRWIRRF